MITIRLFDKNNDYLIYWSEYIKTEEENRRYDTTRPAYTKWGRFMVEHNEKLVGIASYHQSEDMCHPTMIFDQHRSCNRTLVAGIRAHLYQQF
jgi:hypothetical protein